MPIFKLKFSIFFLYKKLILCKNNCKLIHFQVFRGVIYIKKSTNGSEFLSFIIVIILLV